MSASANLIASCQMESALLNLLADQCEPHFSDEAVGQGSPLLRAIVTGEWSRVLLDSSDFASFKTQVFSESTRGFIQVKESFKSWLSSDSERHLQSFAWSVAALQRFVQLNWTSGSEEEEERIDESVLKEALAGSGGEDVVEVCRGRWLLVLARLGMCEEEALVNNIYAKNWTFQWWRFRALRIHQEVLDEERSDDLRLQALTCLDMLESHPQFQKLLQSPGGHEFGARFFLESCHFHATFFDFDRAKVCLSKALEILGLSLEETGALGKRTRFQEKELAQMTLNINKCKIDPNEQTDSDNRDGKVEESHLPADVKLNDEVRLEKVKFSDDKLMTNAKLSLVEKSAVLTALVLKLRSGPRDTLIHEELSPYLETVLSGEHCCWSLHSSALFQRSRLESNDSRAVERAMMQLQTLVDCTQESPKQKVSRLTHLYTSRLPPSWRVEAELCRSLQSLGSTKAALDVALRLNLWEDVIACFHRLQLRHKAAEVIRAELKKTETPKLYCMLGEATDEVEHFHKALELSDNKSARAYRSLGTYYYFRNDFTKAVEFMQKSIELNSFQLDTLLRLGYSATQIEDWNLAATTYRQYCSYDSDNFEAWNNLSNAYVKLGQKARAWKVLQEAVKCDYDNWKIWDNIMVISTDCAHFEEVIRAYHRILDLKEKHVDVEVLRILVRAVCDGGIRDNFGKSASRFHPEAAKLFGRLTSRITTDGQLWQLYAELAAAAPDNESSEENSKDLKVCQMLQKATAALSQQRGWEKDEGSRCKEVIEVAEKYAKAALLLASAPENKSQAIRFTSSARMTIKGIISKVKQNQTNPDDESDTSLKSSFDALENLVEELVRADKTLRST